MTLGTPLSEATRNERTVASFFSTSVNKDPSFQQHKFGNIVLFIIISHTMHLDKENKKTAPLGRPLNNVCFKNLLNEPKLIKPNSTLF
ncbi:hypothetical protein UB51_06450 [Paenibacillus sp. IHBB 10380]|nr:hypothetical protein UB51_06450 [Paenibacillus sp. IHBB 10380]